MNSFEEILYMLQDKMETPVAWGKFHLMCIGISALVLILLTLKKKHSEVELKLVLATYGIIALALEIGKQLIWSINYDAVNNIITWDYQWYAAPFQLCTTPIFVSLICLFLKDGKTRNSLLSYLVFVTIWGGLLTVIIPDSCFTDDTLINIHTMWLHCGSLVLSLYLIISENVKVEKQDMIDGFKVFLVFALLAEILNITVYNMDVLNGEEFNMFYISPYFVSSLPVFNVLQERLPFLIYLFIYILAVFIGANIIYYLFRKRKV